MKNEEIIIIVSASRMILKKISPQGDRFIIHYSLLFLLYSFRGRDIKIYHACIRRRTRATCTDSESHSAAL